MMASSFRQSMTWLHTWAGVILGSLLFVMFWMGTLSVFKEEIDRWMMPMTRISAPETAPSLDALTEKALELGGGDAQSIYIAMPSSHDPTALVRVGDPHGKREERYLDASTMQWLPDPETAGASYFLYPMHFRLHLPYGRWIAGLCAMAMLVMLVSGVIIHRNLFVDFFTFRPRKRLPRSTLDLHNLTSVVALPFHFMITLSGLIIFFSLYYPSVQRAAYPEVEPDEARQALFAEAEGWYKREPNDVPAELASVDAMHDRAKSHWDGKSLQYFMIHHPADAAGYVSFARATDDRVSARRHHVTFASSTGELLQEPKLGPVMGVQRFISGMHFIQFDHWVLRWLYFLAGLAGCVMIATGYVYWMETRRKRHEKAKMRGVRIVQGVTSGSVTGIIAATLAFFVANRVIPMGFSLGSLSRVYVEILVFYLVWLGCFAHGWIRGQRAWREQAWLIGTLSVAAVLLNWVTTGDHLGRTLLRGYWPVAIMDVLLLLTALVSVAVARRLGTPRPARDPKAAAASPAQ